MGKMFNPKMDCKLLQEESRIVVLMLLETFGSEPYRLWDSFLINLNEGGSHSSGSDLISYGCVDP